MSKLAKAAAHYLALRRALGFKLGRTETRLRQFLAFMNRENDSNQNTPDLLMFVNSTLLSMIYIGTIALQNESKGIRYLWNASWKRC